MLFLTTDDLRELTDRTQAAAQIRWLEERNWMFEIGGDGTPKVAMAYFEHKLVREGADRTDGTSLGLPAAKFDVWQVNTEALRTQPNT